METTIISNKEVEVLRKQTRGCARLIHFNSAGASLPPDVVIETVINYLNEEATGGGYETEYKNIGRINQVYDLIAQLINADKDEVAVFENASAAWGTAFKGLTFREGDEIITCEMEYISNLIGFVDIQKTKGVKIKVIPNDQNGNFPLQDFENAITAKTKLIAVTHIPSSGGGMIPIVEIGKITERHKILYMVDACQSAGQFPLDVKQIKCDILSATGRKYLRAPRGTGFIYIKKSVQDLVTPLLLDHRAATNVTLNSYTLRNDAQRFELYEKSRALTLGLGKAIEYALNIGIERIWQRIQHLADMTRRELETIPGISVHDNGDEKCGIVTFSVGGIESAVVKTKLAELGINVSVGAAQATPIYMEKQNLKSIVRSSVHYYNTEDEIKRMCQGLQAIIKPIVN